MYTTSSIAAVLIAAYAAFSCSGVAASSQRATAASVLSLVGQPNQAPSPLPRTAL